MQTKTHSNYTETKRAKSYTSGILLLELKKYIIDNLEHQNLAFITPSPQHICIKKEHFSKTSSNILLDRIIGQTKDFYLIDNKPKQQMQYLEAKGRQHSTFTAIPSQDRKLTNTPNEIDLSTSIQVLMLNQYSLIKGIPYQNALDKFPMMKRYIQNKSQFRIHLQQQITALPDRYQMPSINEVKEILTKIGYGAQLRTYESTPEIEQLQQEMQLIKKTIVSLIDKMDEKLPIKNFVIKNVKRKNQEQQDKGKKAKPYLNTAFYWWYEYQESIVRNAMIQFINEPQTKQVHDAIYSHRQVNVVELQRYVFKTTEFQIIL